MAQGRSTRIISMIKWIRTSRLIIKILSLWTGGTVAAVGMMMMIPLGGVRGLRRHQIPGCCVTKPGEEREGGRAYSTADPHVPIESFDLRGWEFVQGYLAHEKERSLRTPV